MGFQNIVFLFKIMWIFFTELLNYIFFQNYDGFLEGTLIRLSHLNILYVKVFQALSFSKEMISEELNNKMIRYTDNVPWGNEDIDQELLDKVKKKYNITFRGGYDFPIRSGMISLIYKGVRQGKDVILKMKRKDIANRLEEAVDNLLFVIYLFSFIPDYDFDIPKIIRENTEMILNQTDFIEEMKNTKLIRKNCEHLKYVKIPEVYEEVTEEFNDVILMNFIDGERIDKIKVGEYESYAKQVVKFGLTTLLIHGVVHGDLHSGNIIFIKDDNDKKYPYKIGVIDFGIIMRIGCEYKNELIDVITIYLTETGGATIDKVFRSSMIQPKGIVDKIDPLEYKSLLKICGNAVDNAKSNKITVDCNALFETMKDAMKLVNTDKYKELGITFSPDYLKTQMIMAMTNGLTMTLCKNTYNVVLEAALNELFHLDIFMDVDE